MLTNYFLVAIRNLWRNKIVSLINISGLAIGLSCCILILLYTKDEVSYDQFQANKHHLFRATARLSDGKGGEMFHAGKLGLVQAPAFKQQIPEVRDFNRMSSAEYVVKLGNQVFNQPFLYTDANFFSIFSFPLLTGDPRTVLADPHSIVISEDAAKKYFGPAPPVGKILDVEVNGRFQSFTITGLAKTCPQNSSVKFDMLLPMQLKEIQSPDADWLNFNITTFVLLSPNASPARVTAKMQSVFDAGASETYKVASEKYGFNGRATCGLQPMLAIHLSREYGAEDELTDASDPTYSYILTGIAVFVIGIACINFINLTMASSLKRSREIGIRKVIGGRRTQLIAQFLGESFITCFIAFALALLLTGTLLPIFNELANKRLALSYLDAPLVLGFIGLFIFTGIAAGFYPALVLSGFRPVQTLYNRFKLSGRNYLSKTLIVVQFSLAALLIITTIFIHRQFDYLAHKDLGYNDKNLVVVPGGENAGRPFAGLFRTTLLKNPSIQMVALHNRGRQGTSGRIDGKEMLFEYEHIDDQYLPALQVPFVAGRNFSAEFPADTARSALVNESFARQAGWKDPIGKTVELIGERRKVTVVGVVKDFHDRPLNEKIGPLLFVSQSPDAPSLFYIRIAPRNIPPTLGYIEATFKQLVPFYPYTYTFKSADNWKSYAQQEKWKQIISFSAMLTIFISCIGLLGLTALSAEQRKKEFGIRKVLGASIGGIVRLAAGRFVMLVLLANLIAIPIAGWTVHMWLENFAYHIGLSGWIFAGAVGITLAIAGLTIGVQALRAAAANPVESLRSE